MKTAESNYLVSIELYGGEIYFNIDNGDSITYQELLLRMTDGYDLSIHREHNASEET